MRTRIAGVINNEEDGLTRYIVGTIWGGAWVVYSDSDAEKLPSIKPTFFWR